MAALVTGITECVLLYYKESLSDTHHRYRSWEHCFAHFQQLHSTKCRTDVDRAALHLAFYLASWGMYRGSSRLLQKDYRVHTRVVHELLKDTYDPLWHLDHGEFSDNALELDLIMLLVERLRSIYADLEVSPTDTLVTKVLLGTVGCTPAYDTLFVSGVTYWNSELAGDEELAFPARYGEQSLHGLVEFSHMHSGELGDCQRCILEHGMHYPLMKLVDMYFWNLGYQASRS